jgi:hypothetical protein
MSNPIAVLIFGAVVIAVEVVIMFFRGQNWGPHSVPMVGLTLIVVTAVFLAVSDSQRAGAAYALLGVLAGFLVCKYESKNSD